MDFDFSPYFKKYEEVVAIAEGAFKRVEAEYGDCVKCKKGCSDCCYALFDISFIEALYINHYYKLQIKGDDKVKLDEKANSADRLVYKIKRQAYKAAQEGRSEVEILKEMAKQRVRCPLLSDKDECELYDYRPITCRFYGIPTQIGGEAHTCGLSDFKEGERYPTVNLDAIHERLYEISQELVKALNSRYVKMGEVLVPLSMALLTVYDEEYLGIGEPKQAEAPKRKRKKRRK
jgi:Fe-S-cluster containining protein